MSKSENVYGNPFSYLSSSTGGTKPQRSSFRTSEREESAGEQPETKTPFSYLSPNSDPPRLSGGSPGEEEIPTREMGDGADPGEVFASDRNLSKKDGHFNFESTYDPPPPNHYASMQRLAQKNNGHPAVYQGQGNPGYQPMEPPLNENTYTELGKIPGLNDHGEPMYYSGEYPEAGYHPTGSGPEGKEGPQMRSKPVRPNTRDSALGASYRSNSAESHMDKNEKKFSCCFLLVAILLTALICIGIGFAVGWFVKDMVVLPAAAVSTTLTPTGPPTSPSTSTHTTTTAAATPPATTASTTTTTTAATTETTTTMSTTSSAAADASTATFP